MIAHNFLGLGSLPIVLRSRPVAPLRPTRATGAAANGLVAEGRRSHPRPASNQTAGSLSDRPSVPARRSAPGLRAQRVQPPMGWWPKGGEAIRGLPATRRLEASPIVLRSRPVAPLRAYARNGCSRQWAGGRRAAKPSEACQQPDGREPLRSSFAPGPSLRSGPTRANLILNFR